MREAIQPRLLDTQASADYIGVSKRTMEGYIAQGAFPLKRLPHPTKKNEFLRKNLIPREALDAFIRERAKDA